MDVRRVVTGHNADGRAVFVADEKVAPVTLALLPGSEYHQLWGSDVTCQFPDNGARPDARSYFPPVGGLRVGFFTIPPDGGAGAPADLDVEAALAGGPLRPSRGEPRPIPCPKSSQNPTDTEPQPLIFIGRPM